MYRTLVIGRGMFGSAAARHLSKMSDGVALLGPDEPLDRGAHTGVFGSHYDEGRMTRAVDPHPFWAHAAKRSIDRYREIENESGLSFFTGSGYLGIGGAGAEYLSKSEAMGRQLGADIERLDTAGIRERFPFLSVNDDTEGLWEGGDAGHVSPRSMVLAQTKAAASHGATIINAEAQSVRAVTGAVEVETSDGETHRAERVLIATGAFTDLCGLSPTSLRLRVFGRTVVLARIEGEIAETLKTMPTMGHAETGAYILPPIRYPDGQTYLKIGIGTVDDPEPESLADLKNWFKSHGSESNLLEFQRFLVDLIPSLAECRHWHTDTCAVTWTHTGLPLVDYVDDGRIAVAVGGNGKGAKCSDEIGRMGAQLLAGLEWDCPVDTSGMKVPAL